MSDVRPLFATPCYGAMVCMNYASSLLRLRDALWQLGIEHDFFLYAGESLITRARNECVARFMDGKWTHLFFIDSDIGFDPRDAIRLLQAGEPIVAGVYPKKSDEPLFPIDLDNLSKMDGRNLSEANEAPTGFMCIERAVFEKMAAAGIHKLDIFDTMRIGDDYYSEDYAFCRRWRDIGGKIHVAPMVNLTHQGSKLYRGVLAERMV
jgi:GT2 family glycosyltransferase